MSNAVLAKKSSNASESGKSCHGRILIVGGTNAEFMSIQNAVDAATPGDTIRIAPGIYRETVEVAISGTADNPICIESEIPRQAIIRGSERRNDWVMVGGQLWRMPFKILAEQRMSKEFGPKSVPVQVFIEGKGLKFSNTLSVLQENQFCYEDGSIWICLPTEMDPRQQLVEVTIRQKWMNITGDFIHVKGISMQHCAVSVQRYGFHTEGSHCVVENCEFTGAAGGSGAKLRGNNNIYRGNEIHHNGQMGFGMAGTGHLFIGNHVHNNDLRNFCNDHNDQWNVWESGGGKVAYTHHSIFRENRFIDNINGPGLWLDIDNYHNRIENNFFSGNGHSSIMIEISYDNLVCNNIILNTRQSNYSAAGILVQLSSKTRIYHNLIHTAEGYGVHLRWHVRQRDIHPFQPADPFEFEKQHGFKQEDWMTADGDYPVRDNDVRNNIFVDCHWGGIGIDHHHQFTFNNQSDFNLFLNYNSLHALSGGHRLEEWQATTGLDIHSVYSKEIHAQPVFKDPGIGDYRPAKGAPHIGRGKPVPEVDSDFSNKKRPPDHVTIGPWEDC